LVARLVALNGPGSTEKGDDSDLPTIRTAQAAHCLVAALCLKCDHAQDLDLNALAKGYADTPLIHLPLRCGRCGSRAFRVVVSGRWLGEE
jgi:hypothetical protein